MASQNIHEIICFDVDSTLVTCEGVDWLADQKGVGEQVKNLTSMAMEGIVPMEDVFGKKIDILQPSHSEMESIGLHYCQSLSQDAEKVVRVLQNLGKEIWLITGGFAPAVILLAKKLGISEKNILANTVSFNKDGSYKQVDSTNCLIRADGKSICVQEIGYGKRIAFVGDSVTDLATKPYVQTFVGYGGIALREKVREKADYFISCKSLLPLLEIILTAEELERVDKYSEL